MQSYAKILAIGAVVFGGVSTFASINLVLPCLAAEVLASPQAPRYRLGPGDRLTVKLFQVQGFDAAAAVLPDGTLNFMLPRPFHATSDARLRL